MQIELFVLFFSLFFCFCFGAWVQDLIFSSILRYLSWWGSMCFAGYWTQVSHVKWTPYPLCSLFSIIIKHQYFVHFLHLQYSWWHDISNLKLPQSFATTQVQLSTLLSFPVNFTDVYSGARETEHRLSLLPCTLLLLLDFFDCNKVWPKKKANKQRPSQILVDSPSF